MAGSRVSRAGSSVGSDQVFSQSCQISGFKPTTPNSAFGRCAGASALGGTQPGSKEGDRCTEIPTPPPPPLVQATVNDQKLMEPTPSVAWTWALLTRRNLRDTRVDMMYYSENQEAKHATNALLANRGASTQNMNFVHLKTKVSDSTHATQ